MKGHKKFLSVVMAIVISLLIFPLMGCEGIGINPAQDQLRAEYQKGFEDGKREEAQKYKGLDVELAEQIIGDTQRSQGHTLDIINGQIKNVEVLRVDNNGQTAIVETRAYYHSGEYITGVIEFLYKDGYWYPVKTFRLQGPKKSENEG